MRLKKSIAFLMIIMMIFTLLPVNIQAAKKVSLNKKRITLYVGDKYNLKLKNLKKKTKITWKSNNKKVATVSSKGKVTAKRSGKARILAKYKKSRRIYKYTCNVTVRKKKVTPTPKITIQPIYTQLPPDVPAVETPQVTIMPSAIPAETPSMAVTENPTVAPTNMYGLTEPYTDINGNVVWECLYLGEYWQDDTNCDGLVDRNDDKEPIKWRILSLDDNNAFLLADKCLDLRQYHDNEEITSWSDSYIREWLNNEFYNIAFSSNEKASIVEKEWISNYEKFDSVCSEKTKDKITLLSLEELENERYCLINDTNSRYAQNTNYITYNEDADNDWFLRTVNIHDFWDNVRCYTVLGNSTNSALGFTGKAGIRPCLYLDLSKGIWNKAGIENSLGQESDIIELGEHDVTTKIQPNTVKVEFDSNNIVHQGVDGNITWYIDINGCLLLEGKGDWQGLSESTYTGGGESVFPMWLDYADDIYTAKVDISEITNCKDMFRFCYNLRSVDLKEFDTSDVIDMSFMFYGCSKIQTLELNGLNTVNVKNMTSMFERCTSLRKIDVSSFNTLNVTNMSYMFSGCENLERLSLNTFNTSSIVNMDYMFSGCKTLEELKLNAFNTLRLKTMYDMFYNCISLKKLDMSSFDLSGLNVNSREGVFDLSGLPNLQEIKTPKNLSEKLFERKYDGDYINNNLLPMWTKHTTAWKDSKGDIYRIFPLESSESITLKRKIIKKNEKAFRGKAGDLIWSVDENGVLTITGEGEWKKGYEDYPSWHDVRLYIKSCVVKVSGIMDASRMFSDLPYLENIVFEEFDTSKITDMEAMFAYCSSLSSIDVSNFDTSQVTDMSYMFLDCYSLTDLDVSSFDTSQVVHMHSMFRGCCNLKQLDLTGFNLSGVTMIDGMFEFCSKLEELKFDVSIQNIDDVGCIFSCCHSLKSLDLSKWNLDKVESGGAYFLNGAISLTQIRTPINLNHEILLKDGIWMDDMGNVYKKLPINRSSSIILTKTETINNSTASPTLKPTASPTPKPTASPTPEPTASPTPEPTASPTPKPTASPTPKPTASPTPEPTASPTPEPTAYPTPKPTASPTPEPTASPTPKPTATPMVGEEHIIDLTKVVPNTFSDNDIVNINKNEDGSVTLLSDELFLGAYIPLGKTYKGGEKIYVRIEYEFEGTSPTGRIYLVPRVDYDSCVSNLIGGDNNTGVIVTDKTLEGELVVDEDENSSAIMFKGTHWGEYFTSLTIKKVVIITPFSDEAIEQPTLKPTMSPTPTPEPTATPIVGEEHIVDLTKVVPYTFSDNRIVNIDNNEDGSITISDDELFGGASIPLDKTYKAGEKIYVRIEYEFVGTASTGRMYLVPRVDYDFGVSNVINPNQDGESAATCILEGELFVNEGETSSAIMLKGSKYGDGFTSLTIKKIIFTTFNI